MHAERFDGFVGLAGCDKSIPGMLMAAARLDLPSVFVYNGSIMPGEHNGVALDITSVFEAVGACAAGTITEDELLEIERKACPGEGACGGMFTANTMSSIAEALGLSLPGHGVAAGDRRPSRGRRPARRRGGGQHAAARDHPAPDHDEAGVRERDRRHLGARRFDQRRAPPAGDRQRGARRARSRRLQPDRRPGAAHRRHEAGRQVPHERSRPRRWRADGAQAPARRRAAARRRDDGDGQDDGGEPRRDRPASARRRGRLPARPADPHARVGSTCSPGRWRRRVPS